MPQHPVGRLSDADAAALVRTRAPTLPADEVLELVQLCGGVPLLVTLTADAMAAKRIVIGVSCGPCPSVLRT